MLMSALLKVLVFARQPPYRRTSLIFSVSKPILSMPATLRLSTTLTTSPYLAR